MPGIAGIVYPDVFQMNALIEPMLDTLQHRGNDTRDIRTFKNVQVGICGDTFATNEKKTILLALDGTIYNSQELSQELKKHGYSLKSNCDAEVLTYAYEFWGPTFLEHLTGDFALVIVDQEQEEIFLARDRIGKKPLYWFYSQHLFIFGSELKSLIATGAVPQTPAMDALSSYLYFGYIPQDMTAIKDVNKLLPAHYLQMHLDHSKTILPYWSYSQCFEKPFTSKKESVVEDLDHLLRKRVKVEIPSKEEIGCLVSGGLGSATVAYYLSELCPKCQTSAFTVGFQGENDEDVKAAEEVAKDLGLSHFCGTVTPKTLLNDLVKIVWHLDEPLADPNVVASWKLAQLASGRTKTIFSGMGSDELLAGHSRYTSAEQYVSPLYRLMQSSMPLLKYTLIPILERIYRPLAYKLLKQSRTNPWQFEYLQHNALFDEDQLATASPKLAGFFDPEVFLHKFSNLHRIKSNVASYLYFDVKTRLADCFILQYERLTSAHQLDWRAPFLDSDIVEYLARLPEPEELAESEAGSFLKALVKDVLPSSVVDRPKRTRKHFLRLWVKESGLDEIFPLLAKGTLVETGLISQSWVLNQTENIETEEHAFRHLWAVLSLEIWFRLFINHPVQTHPPDITVKDLLLEK